MGQEACPYLIFRIWSPRDRDTTIHHLAPWLVQFHVPSQAQHRQLSTHRSPTPPVLSGSPSIHEKDSREAYDRRAYSTSVDVLVRWRRGRHDVEGFDQPALECGLQARGADGSRCKQHGGMCRKQRPQERSHQWRSAKGQTPGASKKCRRRVRPFQRLGPPVGQDLCFFLGLVFSSCCSTTVAQSSSRSTTSSSSSTEPAVASPCASCQHHVHSDHVHTSS